MNSERIQRQITLVSYGTKFLKTEIGLEQWYRHQIFWKTRLQFRDHENNALLADDFTWWLGILQLAGAVRLSLHLPSQFDIGTDRARQEDSLVIVVHFAERYELWLMGQERARWRNHPLAPSGMHVTLPQFPNAAHLGACLDTYWCMGQRTGNLEVPNTDWPALTRVIAADLDITIPLHEARGRPFILPLREVQADDALPLFPDSAAASPAHRLLSTLFLQRVKFANDTHPKNDDSPLAWAAGDPTSTVYAWGKLLDSWLTEVQLRCANEYRTSPYAGRCPHIDRIYTVAPSRQVAETEPAAAPPAEQPAQTLDYHSMEALEQTQAAAAGRKDKRIRRIGLALGFAGISLLVLAVANVIAIFPWLSLVIGAVIVLLAQFKNDAHH